MIDEKKLIEDLIPILQCLDNTFIVGKIIGLIDSQPKLDVPDTNVGKWIPCSERVPESSMYSVLGWDALRERCCFVKYYKGEWLLRGRFDYENINIIAWMPLPPAYQGE